MAYCDRCERYFGSESALDQHRANSSQHNICYDCDKDFATNQGLTQHFVQSPRHHYCQDCEEDFDDEDDLETHYEEEHHYCGSCRKIFNSENGLHEHNRQKHWYCVSCRRLFNNEHSLNTHLRTSAAHNERTHACPGRSCNMSFITYSDLAQHLESGACNSGITRREVNDLAVKVDRNRVITNPGRLICGPDGSYKRPLIMEAYATERSFNGTAYECVLCHRTFRALAALNAHLNSAAHVDKIYRCPVRFDGCNAEFRTLSGLMQHAESGRCGIHRFQRQVNRALDDMTDKFRSIGFR